MTHNLLPEKGEIYYYPEFFTHEESDRYYQALQEEIEWEHRAIKIFGKEMLQPRLTALYGDPTIPYKYSGLELEAKAMNKTLSEIHRRVASQAGVEFTHVLLNFYRSGHDSMGWHRDNERSLGEDPVIASVSFGATRKFMVRQYQDKNMRVNIHLEHGSLLLMKGKTQVFWEHALPKTSTLKKGRINLTFRIITR